MKIEHGDPRIRLEEDDLVVGIIRDIGVRDLARTAEMSASYLSEWVNGKKAITVESARRICKAAHCSGMLEAGIALAEGDAKKRGK